MFNHQPNDYSCPFCNVLNGTESDHNTKGDIVYQNEHVTALIAPKWWVNNVGHVLVVPNSHHENIYDTPDDTLGEIYKVVKKISLAIRNTYDCQGTSTRQHNEPAGGQDVWHLHVHVYPRFNNDNLYQNHDKTRYANLKDRIPYAEKIRNYLKTNI